MLRTLRKCRDIEKVLCRFILSIVVGFIMGICLFSPAKLTSFHVKSHSWCKNQDAAKAVYRSDTKLIYIGMMSTSQQLDKRAAAALLTWAKRHPNVEVEIFASTSKSKNASPDSNKSLLDKNVRIIQLPGVRDDVYPSQKKSFSMIKYMHDVHLDRFDWFVRLDDDAYVNLDKLQLLLSRVDSTKRWYMGNAGYGKNKEDFVSSKDNYCMGGSGVVMSRELLRHLGPGLKECLLSLYTEHEDIELGRCVRKMTGVKCTEAWQSVKIFYQNFKNHTYLPNIVTLEPDTIDNGIIFHANKEPKYQINFHTLMLKRKIAWSIDRIAKLEREIETLSSSFEHQQPRESPVEWNSIVGRFLFKSDESNLVREMQANMKHVVMNATNKAVTLLKFSLKAQFKSLKNASLIQCYQSTDPHRGFRVISHVLGKYTQTVKRRKVKNLKRTFLFTKHFPHNWVFWEEAHSLGSRDKKLSSIAYREEPTVNFLMALSGRPTNFIRFMHNFESTFLAKGENVNLVVAYFLPKSASGKIEGDGWNEHNLFGMNDPKYDSVPEEDGQLIVNSLQNLQRVYPRSKLDVLFMKPGTGFSRGLGLQRAADHVASDDELLFFCDVDLVFAPEILLHIRRNTIQGKQVYYPTFFSQYDPKIVYEHREKPRSHFSFDEYDGFWRIYSYGMVAMYKSDFKITKGFDLSIVGWGLEDLHLADSVLRSGLRVFKSAEPAEVHVFHDKECDSSLTKKQYTDCLRSRAGHFGPKPFLLKLWENPDIDAALNAAIL